MFINQATGAGGGKQKPDQKPAKNTKPKQK